MQNTNPMNNWYLKYTRNSQNSTVKTNKQTIQSKNSKRQEQTVHKRENIYGKETHEKKFNIINHRNKIKTTIRYQCTSIKMSTHF